MNLQDMQELRQIDWVYQLQQEDHRYVEPKHSQVEEEYFRPFYRNADEFNS